MRRFLVPLGAFVAVCAAACNSSGLYPVSGKVLFNGTPAAGATVTFVRKGNTPAQDSTPQGVVKDDGTFTLVGPAGPGASPGEYVVLVEWKDGAGKTRGRAPALNAPDRLKKRYLDPSRPLLTANVEPKTNNLAAFELK
jgi:hypothetical protein